MKKTAIFGGTFNPVHLGHIQMLNELLKRQDIEKILIMPAKEPPHKSQNIVSAHHRTKMCRLCFSTNSNIEVSDFEIKLTGKSYTVNTLEKLKDKGVFDPFFIIGADSLVNFHLWYRYEDILKLSTLMVYKRAGISKLQMEEALNKLKELGGKIIMLDFEPFDISSTEIRERVKEGKSINGMVPKEIEEYISLHRLYKEVI